MKQILLVICATTLVTGAAHTSRAATAAADNLTSYGKVAWEESATPVRPGVPGEVPFWNMHAKRFIFAPAFDFKEVANAKKYRFDVTSGKTSETVTFEADKPYAPLSPVWTQVPVGGFIVTVVGLNDDGSTAGVAGETSSYRAAPFNGIYNHPPELPLPESATLALNSLLKKDYVQYWFEHKEPDHGYRLYQYPSKIYSALCIGGITQAQLTTGTEEGKRAEELARIIADYMLSIRFPVGSAYEYHVPTYYGPRVKNLKKEHMKLENHMVTMGVDAGTAFLDLYDLVGDAKYLDAAKKIAETYVKTQNDDGTWPLFVRWESGESATPLIAIPTAMVNYFDRLRKDYGMQGLEEPTKKALDYVMANPVKTYNWLGQFEDITPRPDYVNLSREQACELAMYLMRNKGDIKLAEELIRFSEDQFVIWEQPRPIPNKKNPGFRSENWITPSVHEQYVFWFPVGRAAGIMIDTYWEAYKATGKELYLAKAKSIANSFPEMQKHHDGDYITFFTPAKTMNFWLNSVVYPSKVLMNLDKNIKAEKACGRVIDRTFSRQGGRRSRKGSVSDEPLTLSYRSHDL
jgi:maltose/maltodextrin transport system substrate-binding protein